MFAIGYTILPILRDIDVASFLKGERERFVRGYAAAPMIRSMSKARRCKVSDMSDLHSEDCSIFRTDLICLSRARMGISR